MSRTIAWACMAVAIATTLVGCYPSFREMVTSDYRGRVRRIEGVATANACRPTVHERPDWADGIDSVYEISGCTAQPVLYECQDTYRTHRRNGINGWGRDANCQPVLPAPE